MGGKIAALINQGNFQNNQNIASALQNKTKPAQAMLSDSERHLHP